MNEKKEYYFRFYAPGSFTPDTFDVDPVIFGWNVTDWQDIDTDDLMDKLKTDNKLVKEAVWPSSAYAFQIYEGGLAKVGDKPKKASLLYYHSDNRVENTEEVRKNHKDGSDLIRQMEKNKWKAIVRTRYNTILPFEPYTDRILSA